MWHWLVMWRCLLGSGFSILSWRVFKDLVYQLCLTYSCVKYTQIFATHSLFSFLRCVTRPFPVTPQDSLLSCRTLPPGFHGYSHMTPFYSVSACIMAAREKVGAHIKMLFVGQRLIRLSRLKMGWIADKNVYIWLLISIYII